ncbi:MAG: type IV pilus inner membrane component PilO [Planctomycetota bacterium]
MKSGVRKIVFFVVLVGVAYLAYQYWIKPVNERLAEQKTRLHVKLGKIEDAEKTIPSAEEVARQLEKLEEAVQFFESRLPHTSEIDKVLHDVTVIVQNQGLRSKRVLRLQKKDDSGYIEQPLKMELVGDFNSFYSFLLELEELPRIMKIRELELDKQTEHEGQIAANFILSIFFQNKTS